MPHYSELASPAKTREVLERHGLYTKHHLGQNFLVSDWVIGKILDLAQVDCDDVVLEVGPGIGTLSCALLHQGCSLIALEADSSLEPALSESCAFGKDRLKLIWGDAIKTMQDVVSLAPTKFVANLPYQVAATLVLRSFEELLSVERVVVMVQAEVADRMAAQVGTKAYGAYTAKLGLYAQLTERFEVAASNFMPPPHVSSAVVCLDKKPLIDPASSRALNVKELKAVARVIDAAFSQRRKTLRNALSSQGYPKELIDEACAHCEIEPTRRAETLDCIDFVGLARVLEDVGF